MRKAALDRLIGIAILSACVACGASPAYEAKSPTVTAPANEMMTVPADRVVEKCPCDGDTPGWAKPTQYVHVSEWQSPTSAQRAEAFVAEDPSRFKSAHPVPGALSLHRGIPETRVYRMGRSGWRY